MSKNTKIEWADHTFNPWIGCTKVGPGCDNCYAKADFEDRRHRVVWGAGQPRSLTKTWGDPVKWNKQHDAFFAAHGRRQRVFCASLADVFDNEVSAQWRADLFDLIWDTPHLDWMLLTKRIGNAWKMIADAATGGAMALALLARPNVWIGATICNQEEADRDIPKLLETPAARRFLSMEPLLSEVNIEPYLLSTYDKAAHDAQMLPGLSRTDKIDWVIVGGESGPNARPMHPDWALSLRDQCNDAGVPFMFKQWGEWAPAIAIGEDDGRVLQERWIRRDGLAVGEDDIQFFHGDEVVYRAGKKAAGRLLDSREWNGVPS